MLHLNKMRKNNSVVEKHSITQLAYSVLLKKYSFVVFARIMINSKFVPYLVMFQMGK